MSDDQITLEYRAQMEALAVGLDKIFNGKARGKARKTGFVLLVFPYNDDGRADGRTNYISNGADRKDIVVLMKEMIARFEGQPEITGNA